MKKIEKRMTKMIDEMVKNACEKIGYPYDELCTETVLMDLKHNYEIYITNDLEITHETLTNISRCVAKWEYETKQNFCWNGEFQEF